MIFDVSADMFFVNQIPFFVTRSWRIWFITTEGLTGRRKPTLVSALSKVIKFYNMHGY